MERKRLIIIVAIAVLLLVAFFFPKACPGPEVGIPEEQTICSCLGVPASTVSNFCNGPCYGIWYGCFIERM